MDKINQAKEFMGKDDGPVKVTIFIQLEDPKKFDEDKAAMFDTQKTMNGQKVPFCRKFGVKEDCTIGTLVEKFIIRINRPI
jgi:hypothetical protein